MNEETKRLILQVLANRRERLTSVSLDVALAMKGHVGLGNMARLASELVAEGLVHEGPSETPPWELYEITDKGLQYLLDPVSQQPKSAR
jgi:hypothetical protein